MKHKKSSLINQPPEVKATLKKEAEYKLLPRLKFMGYVMTVFSGCSLCYALFSAYFHPTPPSALDENFPYLMEDASFEPYPTDILNFYVVSGIFLAIGISCFVLNYKGKKTHEGS